MKEASFAFLYLEPGAQSLYIKLQVGAKLQSTARMPCVDLCGLDIYLSLFFFSFFFTVCMSPFSFSLEGISLHRLLQCFGNMLADPKNNHIKVGDTCMFDASVYTNNNVAFVCLRF